MLSIVRKAYDWVLHWAGTPKALPALFLISFAESSFFPIPPDVLLIAMTVSIPTRAFYFAFVCTISSVLGGMFGYLLGFAFMEVVGKGIVHLYHLEGVFEKIRVSYKTYEIWTVLVGSFLVHPYKIFTLASGALEVNFPMFTLASIAGRGSRFFLIAALIYRFGAPVKVFIDKYFNLL
ncbi:MAG: cytochrome B, partial [Nitrospinae bacterium RIFCSPLOWO2_12_FULL_47_7]